jgi:hypothetical protein
MALSSTDLAILSARMGVMRMGASRMGFCPDDVEHTGDEPGEYIWKEYKLPTTTWTVAAQNSMCKRQVTLVLGAS